MYGNSGQWYPEGVGGWQGYQNGIGGENNYVRYSKGRIIQLLRDWIAVQYNYQITVQREDKLDYTPSQLRHACAYSPSKIMMLQPGTFQLPEAGVSLSFFFCPYCGKLFYDKDSF